VNSEEYQAVRVFHI